jgi:alpha-tubulin suppressor-like RCC1 family protein
MKQIFFFLVVFVASLSAVAQPTITQPPANQAVAPGGTLTLGVTAGGTAPAYQWFKDSRLIVGATNSTLKVLNAGVTNSGTYYVVVTNASGMVISLPALVAVGSPSLSAWGWNGSGQLGNGTTGSTNRPIIVASNVVAGAAGYAHSLFVSADGTLWAMGWNLYGQLGNGKTTSTNRPVSVASNVVAVAAGYDYSLFVTADGTLWAMGENAHGQLGYGIPINISLPVSVASNVVAVAAGQYHSLFVKTDGTLWGMGMNDVGQLGNGATSGTLEPVSIVSNVVAVAAGGAHSLFVETDGTLWAMGENGFGELGNGTTNNASLPVNVASNVIAVAAGTDHSLFVTGDGTLWAMGLNGSGQLGNGTTGQANTPINVTNNVVAVAAGNGHSLFTKTDATLWAMGNNVYGELGNGTNSGTSPNSMPINVPHLSAANIFPADQAYCSLAMGFVQALATVTLGNLNQIYSGSAISPTAATIPPGLTVNLTYNGSLNAPTNVGIYTVIATVSDPNYYGGATNTLVITWLTKGPTNQVVAVGGTMTMGVTVSNTTPAYQWFKDSRMILGATNSTLTVTNAGVTNSGTYYVVMTNMSGMIISLPASVAVGNPSLLAWGLNDYGQLGNGTTITTNRPVSVVGNVVAGAAGGYHSLFMMPDGTLWAMGYNNYGQLGNGTTSNTNLPVNVASNVVAVAGGYEHSLFVTADGTLWAMGYNMYGQLGNGTTGSTNRPVSVASNVMAVAAGEYHSLFLKTDGTLWAMGYNNDGQLGVGTTIYYTNWPVSVASNVVAAAAGVFHSLFVKADGTLWAMGNNSYGQLGSGTWNNAILLPIMVGSNVVAVAAGGFHSLFVKTDGTLWAMGENNSGQLGNGKTINTNWPVAVASNVVVAAAGNSHSLFVKTDGTLWAMGANSFGQLGNGTTSNTNWPVSFPHMPVANIFPADQALHSLATGIIKTSANVTLGNLNQLYTGSVISVTACTTPPGLTVNLTYNGSPNAPTNAGSYTVVGTVTDPNYYGSATNTLVVGLPPQSFTASSTAGSANGQQLILQLAGTPGYPYILQMATNLTPPVVWQCVFTNCADTNGNCNFTITNLTVMPEGFYRAVGQ